MVEGQEEDPEKEALKDEIRQLAERVSELESALRSVTQPLGSIREQIESMGSIAHNYFKLLELYQRKGEISPEAVLPELKDPISVEIVKVLFDQGGLNVSEVISLTQEEYCIRTVEIGALPFHRAQSWAACEFTPQSVNAIRVNAGLFPVHIP